MNNKKLLHSHKAHASRSMGPSVRQVIPGAISHIDPFVFLDHFGPVEKRPGGQGVPPHPHAGIATITYLFVILSLIIFIKLWNFTQSDVY